MGRPHRLSSDAYALGFRHFLTTCTYRRRRYFEAASIVELVRSHFLRRAADESVAVLAYCYMPDHLHLVVEVGNASASVPRFVRLAKQHSGFHFSRSHGQRLWQESYFDRALRHDEALVDVLRYVINNPVRAGLVESPEDYPHWGSGQYAREEILEEISRAIPQVRRV